MDFRWISGFHNGFSTIAYEISVVSDPSGVAVKRGSTVQLI